MAKAKEKIVISSGKRKRAIARCRIKPGKGVFRINSIAFESYSHQLSKLKIEEPLLYIPKRRDTIDISVNIKGGGVMGQAEAIRTSIAKGLVEFFDDEVLRHEFLRLDRTLLVSDTRRKEPKHPLGKGARKKRQKSYR